MARAMPGADVALDLHRRLSRRDQFDFTDLLDWLEEAEIDRLGCFKYEPVAGAASNAIGNVVPDEVKQERWNALMARQQKISARRLKRKVGSRQQVIIDEVGPTVAKGRSKADAPQIDGTVYLSSRRPLKVGEIITARIERADEYDLHGSRTRASSPTSASASPAMREFFESR